MKTIQTLLQTAIVVAALAPSTLASSRLRGGGKPKTTRPPTVKSWAVSYDTRRACLPGASGRVVATIKPTASGQSSGSRGAAVVFRLAGPGRTAPYVQKSRIQANGRATVSIRVMDAFYAGGRTSGTSLLACTVQVGNGAVQKVACPPLPECTIDDTGLLGPTPSPTPDDSGMMAPTSSPTPDDSGMMAPTSSPTPDESGLMAPTTSPTHELIVEGPGFVAPTESPTTFEDPDFVAPTSSPTILEGPGFMAPTEAPTTDESDLLAPTE